MPVVQTSESPSRNAVRRGSRRRRQRSAPGADAFQPSTPQWRAGSAHWRLSRNSARQLFAALLVAVFAVSMIELMSRIDRFQIASSQLINNQGFLQGLESWNTSGEQVELQGMQAVFRGTLNGRNGEIRQRLELPAGYYRISAEVRAAATSSSMNAAPRLRLELASPHQSGASNSGVDVRLSRTAGWRPVSELVHLSSPDADFRAIFSGGGEFRLRNPRVVQLAELGAYRIAKGLFLTLLMLAVIGAAVSFWHHRHSWQQKFSDQRKRRNMLLIIIPVVLAVLAALVPGRYSLPLTSAMHAGLPDGLLQLVSNLPGNPLSHPSDVGHLLAFAVIGVLIGWRYQGRAVVPPLAMACALALMIEALQTLTRDRTASYADVGVDASGLLAGLLVAMAALWLYQRRQVRSSVAETSPPVFQFNSGDKQNYDIATPVVKRRRRRKAVAAEPVE